MVHGIEQVSVNKKRGSSDERGRVGGGGHAGKARHVNYDSQQIYFLPASLTLSLQVGMEWAWGLIWKTSSNDK